MLDQDIDLLEPAVFEQCSSRIEEEFIEDELEIISIPFRSLRISCRPKAVREDTFKEGMDCLIYFWIRTILRYCQEQVN